MRNTKRRGKKIMVVKPVKRLRFKPAKPVLPAVFNASLTGGKSSTGTMSRNYGGFPQTKIVKLRYHESRQLADSAAGEIHSLAYRANGAYDPFASIGGHQPMGYDNWTAIYQKTLVLGSKIWVKYMDDQGELGADTNYVVGLTIDDDTSFSPTTSEAIERGTSQYRILPRNSDNNAALVMLSKGFSTKKWFGIKDYDDDLRAAYNANPAKQAYFVVWGAPLDQTSEHGGAIIDVVIEYVIQFSEPKDMYEN